MQLLFQHFEYQGVYIRPSETLLSNKGRKMSSTKIAYQETFKTSRLKTVYRMSSPDVFSKKGVLLQIFFIFLEEYPYKSVISVELNSAWMFSCKLAKCRTLFLKNTSGWLLLYIWKLIQRMPAGIHLFRVNIEKLEQGVK